MMRQEIRAVYGPFIDKTLDHIRVLIADAPDVFQPILTYHLRPLNKTKGFRIALVKALHDVGIRDGYPLIRESSLIDHAACLHLLHEASLILDDILDQDVVRRGQRAVHCRYGRVPAASAAAWLCAFVANHFVEHPDLARAIFTMGEEIAAAEILQWKARLDARPVNILTWQRIAEGDTGALFRLGARFAGIPVQSQLTGTINALTYLYHGLDDIQDIEDVMTDDGFAGGGDADLRDHIPTLMTCFTAGKEREDLYGAVPDAKRWLRQFQNVPAPPELHVFFRVLGF